MSKKRYAVYTASGELKAVVNQDFVMGVFDSLEPAKSCGDPCFNVIEENLYGYMNCSVYITAGDAIFEDKYCKI